MEFHLGQQRVFFFLNKKGSWFLSQVSADVLSVLMDKLDIINLDIFTFLIPILTSLMEGKVDRYVIVYHVHNNIYNNY